MTMAPPSQILLFSQPRTACHMLVRTLSFQPDVKYLMHPYVKARPLQVQYLADESVAKGIPEDLRKPYVDQVNLATQAWEAALEEAKEKVRHPSQSYSPGGGIRECGLSLAL